MCLGLPSHKPSDPLLTPCCLPTAPQVLLPIKSIVPHLATLLTSSPRPAPIVTVISKVFKRLAAYELNARLCQLCTSLISGHTSPPTDTDSKSNTGLHATAGTGVAARSSTGSAAVAASDSAAVTAVVLMPVAEAVALLRETAGVVAELTALLLAEPPAGSAAAVAAGVMGPMTGLESLAQLMQVGQREDRKDCVVLKSTQVLFGIFECVV